MLVPCALLALFPFPSATSSSRNAQAGGWKIITTINMMLIFFIFGITLETSELKSALKGWKVLLLGIVSILFITAVTGFVFINMDFKPREFGYGLAIFACVPTSLSSGVSLVIQGYGNAALALLMTVTTNILGIFISPIMVKLILSSAIKNIKVNAADLVLKLSVSIIVPLVAGKATREFIPAALRFAKEYKVPLYLINQFQIIMIVWQTLSHSAHELLNQAFYDILFAIMGAIGQHCFFLVLSILIAWVAPFLRLRMQDVERKAFIIMAAQKSLPTAAVIISYLPAGSTTHGGEDGADRDPAAGDSDGLGDLGLVAIPCIVFYVMQVFIDAFLANGWASKYEKGQQLQDKYADQLAELAKLDPDAPSLMPQGGEANGADGKEGAEGEGDAGSTGRAGAGSAGGMEEVKLEVEESDKARLLGAAAPSDGSTLARM